MGTEEKAVAVTPQTTSSVEYKAGTELVKLTGKMVLSYLVKPTKAGKTASPVDVTKFIMLCKAQRLNPWLGDAFLVGYDSQSGPEFSMITSHASLLKRADGEENYKGLTSGVIVKDANGEVVELQGKFRPDDSTLLGAWAEVNREDRSFGRKKIRLQAFEKSNKFWQRDKEGMIVKCAEAAALREAFPNILSGSYIREEMMKVVDVTDGVEVSAPRGAPVRDALPSPDAIEQGESVKKPKEPKVTKGGSRTGKTEKKPKEAPAKEEPNTPADETPPENAEDKGDAYEEHEEGAGEEEVPEGGPFAAETREDREQTGMVSPE